jgi:hypothetical protein
MSAHAGLIAKTATLSGPPARTKVTGWLLSVELSGPSSSGKIRLFR